MEVTLAGQQNNVQQTSTSQEESEKSKEVRMEGNTRVESTSSRHVQQSVTQKVTSSSVVKQSSFSSTSVSSSQQDPQQTEGAEPKAELTATCDHNGTGTPEPRLGSSDASLPETQQGNETDSKPTDNNRIPPAPDGSEGKMLVATVTTQQRIQHFPNLNGDGVAPAAPPADTPSHVDDEQRNQPGQWQQFPQAMWSQEWQDKNPPPPPPPGKDLSDLPQDNIKSSLKEIISDLERADLTDGQVEVDAASKAPNQLSNGTAERRNRMDRQTSTTTLEQALLKEHQDGTLAALAALLSPAAKTGGPGGPGGPGGASCNHDAGPPPPAASPPTPPPMPRPPKIPVHNLVHLLQSVQIAHELNMVLNRNESRQEELSEESEQHYINHVSDDDRSRGGPAHIDLEKLFTPATDSGESTPSRRKSRMYASSSFYGPEHPTVEEQVELARRISSSLSDISNQRSKGQTMYVNRKKRSAKWVHEATDESRTSTPTTPLPDAAPPGPEKEKPVLKLVMDPRGQVQDLWSLRKQGVPVDPACGALSPEVCFHLVRDLNAPRGKGAELFAKRRKKSEKWVVDETTVKTSSTMESPKLPVPAASYLTNGTTKVQTVQRMNEIQEKFSQPRLKLVKSPWEAALETGSVDGAFLEEPKLLNKANGVPRTPVPAPPPRTPATGAPTWTATTAASTRPLSTPDATLYAGRGPRGWGQHQQNTYGDSALLSFRGPPEEPAPLLLRQALGSDDDAPSSAAPNAAPEPPPRTVFLDYNLLQNYNTAPRGWGGSMDYYRPVTFSKPIAATDL